MVAPSRAPLRVDRLRALNLPRQVELELDAQGRPAAVRPQQDGRAAETAAWHPVEAIGETWRVDDEWWRQPISRRYVEVVLEGGKHVVLFEDLVTGQWWLQKP